MPEKCATAGESGYMHASIVDWRPRRPTRDDIGMAAPRARDNLGCVFKARGARRQSLMCRFTDSEMSE
jgi:hypothetical protein